MVIEPLGDLKLSEVNANLLSVPTGFAFGIITALWYSVNLPNQAPYQLGHTRIWSWGNLPKVVKLVVKGYFRPEQGRSQEEKVPAPQRVFGLACFCRWFGASAPKAGALPTALHPVIPFIDPAGRIHPKRAQYPRHWGCPFIPTILQGIFFHNACCGRGDTTPETSAIIHRERGKSNPKVCFSATAPGMRKKGCGGGADMVKWRIWLTERIRQTNWNLIDNWQLTMDN